MDAPDLEPFDLVLAGGTVIDGTAEAVPHVADVGIRGGTIAAIGDLGGMAGRGSEGREGVIAKRLIDCTGLVVCPGFIDPHTHVEVALTGDAGAPGDAHAPAAQGITTVLTSPDGFGWAPLPTAEARELWMATQGIYGDWPADFEAGRTTSIARYLDGFRGSEVHVVPQVPHSAVRFAVMGWADGPASPKQLDRMRGIVGEWMDAGAVGLTVGLEYEQGARASTEGLTALCEVVAAHGGGSLAAHIRYLDLGREDAYREVIEIGRRTGVTVNIAHETLDARTRPIVEALPAQERPAIETYVHPATSTTLATDVERADRVGGPMGIARLLRDPEAFARVEGFPRGQPRRRPRARRERVRARLGCGANRARDLRGRGGVGGAAFAAGGFSAARRPWGFVRVPAPGDRGVAGEHEGNDRQRHDDRRVRRDLSPPGSCTRAATGRSRASSAWRRASGPRSTSPPRST